MKYWLTFETNLWQEILEMNKYLLEYKMYDKIYFDRMHERSKMKEHDVSPLFMKFVMAARFVSMIGVILSGNLGLRLTQ